MKEKFKPCPFCGNKNSIAIINQYPTLNDGLIGTSKYGVAVCCRITHGGCGCTSGFRSSEEDAVKVWNNRSENLIDKYIDNPLPEYIEGETTYIFSLKKYLSDSDQLSMAVAQVADGEPVENPNWEKQNASIEVQGVPFNVKLKHCVLVPANEVSKNHLELG